MTLAMQFLLVLHSAWEHGFTTLCLPACNILTLKHDSSSPAETHSSSAAPCKKSSVQQKDSEQKGPCGFNKNSHKWSDNFSQITQVGLVLQKTTTHV